MIPAVADAKKLRTQSQFWWEDFQMGLWNLVVEVDYGYMDDEAPEIIRVWSEGQGQNWVELPIAALPDSFIASVEQAIELEIQHGSESYWDYREVMGI